MARIIFADDDPLLGEMVASALINAGHAVGWVGDGEQAIRAIQFRPPELVILDLDMPEATGMDVLREMRRVRALSRIPVLMLTANAGREDQNIAYYDGADDYLTKPCDPEEVVFRAEVLIRQHSRSVESPQEPRSSHAAHRWVS